MFQVLFLTTGYTGADKKIMYPVFGISALGVNPFSAGNDYTRQILTLKSLNKSEIKAHACFNFGSPSGRMARHEPFQRGDQSAVGHCTERVKYVEVYNCHRPITQVIKWSGNS